jgi:Ca-activated chloride channel family protein
VLERANAGVVETQIAPGRYDVTVERGPNGARGTASLDVRGGGERTRTSPLDIPLAATVAATPPAGAPAGSAVSVAWTGPDRDGDYVTIVKAGADAREYLSYADTARGTPAAIELPAEPGDYEIRYVLGRPQRVLAALPYPVTAVGATVSAPATGAAGGTIVVAFTGPGYASDWVTVVQSDAVDSAYADYFDVRAGVTNGEDTLDLPVDPGSYEVRYVQDGKKVLARSPIAVGAATAELTAPASVAPGAAFEVTWTGPNNRGDWLTIVPREAAASAYASYVDADRGAPQTLRAPAAAGVYELRSVLRGKTVIATRPVTVQ